MVFEERKLGNIDNDTKIVSAIIGNDSNKIKEELLEEINPYHLKQRQQIDEVIDDGIIKITYG